MSRIDAVVLAIALYIAVVSVVCGIRHHKRKEDEEVICIIAEGMKRYAEKFDGLYSLVWEMHLGKLEDGESLFEEWCIRAANAKEGDAFCEYFKELAEEKGKQDESFYQKWADRMVVAFEQAGIVRDEQKEITYEKGLGKAYIVMGTEKPKEGQLYEVISPCWRQNGKVIDQGIIK